MEPPTRIPLEVGLTSLRWAVWTAIFFWFIPFAAFLSVGVLIVSIYTLWGLLLLPLTWIAALRAARASDRHRPSDVVIDHNGARIEGGPDDGRWLDAPVHVDGPIAPAPSWRQAAAVLTVFNWVVHLGCAALLVAMWVVGRARVRASGDHADFEQTWRLGAALAAALLLAAWSLAAARLRPRAAVGKARVEPRREDRKMSS